jgi:pyruvate dehydrogenase E2 component (dihydrolipoamide acetyltransferase)
VNTVESPFAGTLRRIVGEQGTAYPVGALIAVYADAGVSDAEIDAFIAAFKPAETGFEPPTESAPQAARLRSSRLLRSLQEVMAATVKAECSPIARRVAQKPVSICRRVKGAGSERTHFERRRRNLRGLLVDDGSGCCCRTHRPWSD